MPRWGRGPTTTRALKIGYCHYRLALQAFREAESRRGEAAEFRKQSDESAAAAKDAESEGFESAGEAQFTTAREKLDGYLTYTRETELRTEERKAKRAESVASAILILASICLEQEDFRGTIAFLLEGGEIHPLIAGDEGSKPSAIKYVIKANLGLADEALAGASEEGTEPAVKEAAIRTATNLVRTAESWIDRLAGGVHLRYYYSYRIGRSLDALYRLTNQRGFREDSTIRYADWITEKIGSGGAVSFSQAYVVGRRLQDLAEKQREEDDTSTNWREYLTKCQEIFQLCVELASPRSDERGLARLQLARIHQELDQFSEALTQYYQLYQQKRHIRHELRAR